MTEETQKELLALSKRALTLISVSGVEPDFVFVLRDIIRKAESENDGRS
jgi:hypothetical protein